MSFYDDTKLFKLYGLKEKHPLHPLPIWIIDEYAPPTILHSCVYCILAIYVPQTIILNLTNKLFTGV